MRRSLLAPLALSSLMFAGASSAAPDEVLPKSKSALGDLSQIVGLAQDDARSLLPFGNAAQAAQPQANAMSAASSPTPAPAPGAKNPPPPAMPAAPAASMDALVGKLAMPALFFIALLAGMVVLARKKAPSRHVKVMEVTMLGKGRSVVVADIAGKPVLLGVSEGGVNLLMDELAITATAPVVDARQPSLLERLFFFRKPAPSGFDVQMFDSTDEDDELRRKIAAHLSGSQPISGGVH